MQKIEKLVLNLPENMHIDINGDIFDIIMSDIDIINKCVDFHHKYANLNKNDVDSIKAMINELSKFIDDIIIPTGNFGTGATAIISKGKSVNINLLLEWLFAICRVIGKNNDVYIENKYE